MASEAFAIASRALRSKRRAFSNEITSFLNDASSEEGVSKEVFNEKNTYFEQCWEEIVTSTNDCVGLVDDVEEKGERIDELNEQLGGLWVQK